VPITAALGSGRSVELRRLALLVGAVVFLDTMFYAVVAPLLPQLVHQLHLSKLSAGLLTAAYPAGTLLAAVPGGVLAVRLGPRFSLSTGLALLAAATIGFGFLRSAAGLDLARFVEGVGGACSWAGGIAWLVAEVPLDRRGVVIGRALAAAIGGALLGPALGGLASVTGRPLLFSAVAAVAVGLIVATRRLSAEDASSGQGMGALLHGLRRPAVIACMWLTALPAVISGLVNVLGPLRMHGFGAGAGAIGATFLVAAGLEALISPAVGGISDRYGRLAPMRAGLAVSAVALLLFTAPRSAFLVAVIVVLLLTGLGGFWAPSMAMLSDVADATGLDQALGAALVNLAWAGGQILGSGGGGAIAKAAGDGVPMAASAALCVITLVVVVVVVRRAPMQASQRIG
jgi:MFS family permease